MNPEFPACGFVCMMHNFMKMTASRGLWPAKVQICGMSYLLAFHMWLPVKDGTGPKSEGEGRCN